MSATITTTRGYTFGATELVTNTKLHTLIDSATSTISGIVGAELASGASIVYTQLAQIGAASMVCGSAFWGLATIPAAAGVIPNFNLPIYSANTTTADNTAAGSITIKIDGVDYRILYA